MATFDTFSLDTLNGRNGFRVDHWKQFFANWVSSAGDVNGDGIDDLFIGQWHASNKGVSTSYVVFGSEQPFAASMGSGSLDGANGFYLRGAETADYAGAAVASAGDVNGDGIDDLILGAPWASVDGHARAGRSYVVFGSDAGFPAWFSLADLDGSNGFHLAGDTENGFAGYAVSSAGDVNNDGVDDLLIGVPNSLGSPDENETTPGETYVVFGSTTGFPASLALTDMDGQSGFRLLGTHPLDKSGFSVASAGDVNGDGIGDIIVGAPGTDPNGTPDVGESFVVFGSDAGFPETVSASDLDGTNGFRVRGTFGTGQSGFSVSTAGDFNGDGFDDLIIGAQYAGLRRGDQRGESYIVFGTDAGFPETLSVFDLDGGNGFRFVGRTPEDYLGFSVAAAGDVNGDGFDDVIVGAPGADNGGVSQAGESYVLLGAASGFAALFTPDDLNGQNGFRLEGGGGKQSGASVSGAGDINNDGFDDLIIGAPSAPSPESNYAYVIFGAATGFRYASALGTDGSDWMSLPANWRDVLIGIDGDAGTDMMSFAGLDAQVYVNLGTGRAASIDTSAPFDLTMTGVENITGTGYGDMLVGGDASEWLRGLGGDDMIFGRGAAADRYDGGAGRDTLSYGFAGEGVSVSLFRGIGFAGEAQGDRLSAIENVIGSAHDDIIWGDHGANKLQGGAGDDMLIGNGGDDYLLGGFGQDVVLYAGNQSDYQIRQDGAATWVTDLAGGGGTDLIGQVEILRFADGDLLL